MYIIVFFFFFKYRNTMNSVSELCKSVEFTVPVSWKTHTLPTNTWA